MSYDLTLKPNKIYSKFISRPEIEAFIAELPSIKPNGSRGFVLDEPPSIWMEIDLEHVSEEGDTLPQNEDDRTKINCIRFHIPYEFLREDDFDCDYLTTAERITDYLGWELFDDQSDTLIYKKPAESKIEVKEEQIYSKKPWWKFW